MACYSLCLYLLMVFLNISAVLSHNDYLFYDSELYHSPEHHIEFESLDSDSKHVLQKRGIAEANAIATETAVHASVGLNVTVEDISLPPRKKNIPKIQNQNSTTSISESSVNNSLTNSDVENITEKGVTLTAPNSVTTYVTKVTKSNTGKNDSDITTSKSSNTTEIEDDYPDADPSQLALKHNMSLVKIDSHSYYNSCLINDPEVGMHYWVDLTDPSKVNVNSMLSNSHRRAATVQLSFEFPFYGHWIKNVTIATGGFLYTGDYVHSWLAATQYIAPLMANFDTSVSNRSFIKYVDNGTAFTVEWENVALQEKPDDGEFTFQVTLHENGDVVFVYKSIPLYVERIEDAHHPVKVGLSDAYILDRTVFYVRRKTIYEYHRVEFKKEDIRNWTVIYLTLLPTCLDSTDCTSCLSRSTSFPCLWCPSLNKCSTGIDRNRQEWLAGDCLRKHIGNETMCYHPFTASRVYASSVNKQTDQVGISGIIAIIFLITMVSGLTFWVFYAYRNPHTTSGQILIKYRPSQWGWRRGEARYTAATIHM